MTQNLTLTKDFFASVSCKEYEERRIIFTENLPDIGKITSDFLFSSEDGILEIVLIKGTVMKIFNECHPLLEQYLENRVDYLSNDDLLIRIYYMTVGMLVTTHEHHTVVNIHTDIVLEILKRMEDNPKVFTNVLVDPSFFIFKELNFIQSILNSNNSHLNKSSSLWKLFKMLFTISLDNPETIISKLPELFFVKTALKAADLHPLNYYAWNFLRFVNNVSKLQVQCSLYLDIMQIIERYCKSHISDISAWMCYVDLVQVNMGCLNLIVYEFNRYSKNIKLFIDPKRILLTFPSSNQPLMDLSKWLWDNKVVSEAPYHAFQQLSFYSVKVWNEKDLVRELFSQIKIHCTIFEELKLKPCEIDIHLKNGYFTLNIDTSTDLELDQTIKTYFNWKKLLNWYDTFLKDKYIMHTP